MGARAPDTVGFAIDRHALACLRLYMFLPLTQLLGIDPGKAASLAEGIRDEFGVPEAFLDRRCAPSPGTRHRARPCRRSTPATGRDGPGDRGARRARVRGSSRDARRVAHRISSAQRAQRVLLLDGASPALGSHRELQASSASYRELTGRWTR